MRTLRCLSFAVACVISGWITTTSLAESGDDSPRHRPNVLLISIDDLNDWVGFLGGSPTPVHTPHLDGLAARGVAFANAHCDAPVCNPSRTAVLTGRRPSSTGIYDNRHWWRPHLSGVVTMPEHFRAHGYAVAGGGKVLHHTLGNNPPDLWDEFFAQVQDGTWHFDYPVPGQHVSKPGVHWPDGFPLNGLESVRLGRRPPNNFREFDWGPFDRDDATMGDGQMVAWAERFLARNHSRPFFLAVGIYRPHLPWYAPREYFERYPLDAIRLPKVRDDDLDDIPEPGRRIAKARYDDYRLVVESGRYRRAVQAYLASITFADALVGRLVRALDKRISERQTIIVLWSDHGWHLGEKLHWHKMTLWEEATRVPLIIVAPVVARSGTRSSRPVNLVDLYPTLVELCDLPSPTQLDGQSLTPLLANPDAPWSRPALTTYLRGNHAVRDEHWRYIRYANGDEELYDHRRDPHEWTNIASRESSRPVIERLRKALPSHDAPAAPTKSAWRFDPSTYSWTRR